MRRVRNIALWLGSTALLASAVSLLIDLNICVMWAIVMIAILVNGQIATWEDRQPRGIDSDT